ncbi:uncharacterized protein LOC127439018 isoform X2 [Myxocyprinus asiaticus]|uniref:uncharacterized protein LOC127439018 isoform X2 n=1 Tax=Myxocyprinus asiaticus TaxID=70543 RepID=UPI0022213357|nr:uncharacterized protein LOC127439018 isoform X2 [Myxocyprinus asiaticus]
MKKSFTVTVYDSLPVIDPGRSEVMSLSVIEGESVTLNTDIKPHGDELIVWRFGDILIAKDDKENNKTSFYPDERFKERIQLDQTGSLIIRDIRTTDTGEYKLKISSSNRETKHKRFILFVRDEWKTVFMMKGESVTLITDDAHIKTDDVNMYHGETLIAEIRRGKITRLKDEIRERLKLDDQTGSLFITDTRHTDSGVYYLKIINSTEDIIYKRIIVTVSVDSGSVTPTLPRGKVKELDSLNNATDVGVNEKQGTSSV